MTTAFIKVFYELLNSRQDNIEVSYNSAGVLAHILSDGEEAWAVRGSVCESSFRIKDLVLSSQSVVHITLFSSPETA